MSETSTIGLDLAKHVFQLHGADAAGRAMLRKQLRRGELLRFLGSLEPCVVAMEACGSAHYWGREIARLGHEVRLIAPAYVKPFVKRQKNDAADAEAICEAAQRPSMALLSACLGRQSKGRSTTGTALLEDRLHQARHPEVLSFLQLALRPAVLRGGAGVSARRGFTGAAAANL